ncbi:MAG: UpxY family transcription antiterminator [Polaribacter sp.]|nr:UpxY family transcription antiterminator [Polaribacter sp.]
MIYCTIFDIEKEAIILAEKIDPQLEKDLDIVKDWYALYTAPRAEKKVHERLENAGYTVYLPLATSIRQWSDRKKKVTSPLISSYVFIQINATALPIVRNEIGVVGVLNEFGKPARIKDFEIENLKILLKESDSLQLVSGEAIPKGTPVRVVKGELSGIIGEVVQQQNNTKLIVRIDAFSHLIEVNIPLSFVETIKDA